MNKTVITGIAAVLAIALMSSLMYYNFGEPALLKRASTVYMALDTNADGKLDAEEIETATKTLQSLDKNEDGSLTAKELKRPKR